MSVVLSFSVSPFSQLTCLVKQIWSKTIQDGRFELELIRQLHHTDPNRDTGANITAGISCILALPQVVYTGDESGRVVSIVVR